MRLLLSPKLPPRSSVSMLFQRRAGPAPAERLLGLRFTGPANGTRRELLLDTLPAAMPAAVRLYRALGFQPAARYNENDGPEFAFYRLRLE